MTLRSSLHCAKNAHGNRRDGPNGLVAGEDDVAEVSPAVITPSPSFKPSRTSVTTPSLIPVLIITGSGLFPDKTYTVRSFFRSCSAPARTHVGGVSLAGGGVADPVAVRVRRSAF